MKAALLFALSLIAALPAAAQVTFQKLLPNYQGLANLAGQFGINSQSTALNHKWLLVGAPFTAVNGIGCGVVHVYNASTGAFVRRLQPAIPVSGIRFGSACAVQGDLAAIAADGSGTSNTGQVFIYQLTTGKRLATLTAPGAPAANQFGRALAMEGQRLLVTARVGGAWLFDLRNYTLSASILGASDTTPGDGFGWACAMEGDLAAISAPLKNGENGSVYLFRMTSITMEQIQTITPLNANQYLGTNLLLHQGLVISGTNSNAIQLTNPRTGQRRLLSSSVGASVGQSIAAENGLLCAMAPSGTEIHLFNLHSTNTNEFQRIPVPPESTGNANLGNSIAIHGSRLVISDPSNDTLFPDAGAAYLFRGLSLPDATFTELAQLNTVVPSSGDARLATFDSLLSHPDGLPAALSRLSGPGTAANTHRSLWTGASTQGLKARTGSFVNGLTLGTSFRSLLANHASNTFFQASLTGTGITSATNLGLFRHAAGSTFVVAQKGTTLFNTNLRPTTFSQVSQSGSQNQIAIATRFAPSTVAPLVSQTSDSGVMWKNLADDQHFLIRESGQPLPSLPPLGETGAILAHSHNHLFFSAFLTTTDAATNQALFRRTSVAPAGVTEKILRKGDFIINDTGSLSTTERFTSLLAISADDAQMAVAKATYKSATTGKTVTGLWRIPGNAPDRLFLQTGTPIGSLKVSRIEQFWASYLQCLALVRLSGPGVTAAIDRALILCQTTSPVDGSLLVLLREGDSAPGCQGARIGTLQRLDVDPIYGHYVVLASLAGSPTSSNLALFRGHSRTTTPTAATTSLRKPYLVLRKGMTIGTHPPLTSITLPANLLTKAGAGSAGLGSILQRPATAGRASSFVTTLTFGNKSRVTATQYTGVSL